MNKNIIKINFKELQIYTYWKQWLLPQTQEILLPNWNLCLELDHAPLYKNLI